MSPTKIIQWKLNHLIWIIEPNNQGLSFRISRGLHEDGLIAFFCAPAKTQKRKSMRWSVILFIFSVSCAKMFNTGCDVQVLQQIVIQEEGGAGRIWSKC